MFFLLYPTVSFMLRPKSLLAELALIEEIAEVEKESECQASRAQERGLRDWKPGKGC